MENTLAKIWMDEDAGCFLTVFLPRGLQLNVPLSETDLKQLHKDATEILENLK